MGIIQNLFSSKFDKLNLLLDEIYSLLHTCESDSCVLITIVDPMKEDIMEIVIDGKSWMNNATFINELKELHSILVLNIKYNRIITVTLIN